MTCQGKSDRDESGKIGRDWTMWSFVGQRCERSEFYSKYDGTAAEGF